MNDKNSKFGYSIVVPCYNEVKRLPATLLSIKKYLKNHPGGEVIVVDDGSFDDTAKIVVDSQKGDGFVRLIRHSRNLGKGTTVRAGILQSRGEVVCFIDADGSMDINELDRLAAHLGECDIVISSKYLLPSPDAKRQDLNRAIIARLGNWLVRILFGLHFADTQSGFKVFKRAAARKLFSKMVINRWAFDVELLVLAKKQGFKVKEVAVPWVNTDDSRVDLLPAVFTTLRELAVLRWRLWRGYYDL